MDSSVVRLLQNALGDRYRVEHEIARGGMATVYLARDLRHDRDVALKVMHPQIALALGRERFLREIKLAAALSHPNILTLHDSGEAGDYLYYVMPYVEGETLRHKLTKEGSLSIDVAVRLARESAEAIGYAHSLGIVHRDIKPENILLSRGHAVVADFGIARAIDAARDDRITTSGVALGTTAYMSPEQALGDNIDARADVWALGCILFEMIAGRPPFGSSGREVLARSLTGRPDSLREIRPDVPEGLEQIIQKSLARNPSERFASASEFAAALDEYRTASGPVSARRPIRISQLAVIAGIAVIVIAGTALMMSQRDSKTQSVATAAPARGPKLSADSTANELYRLGRTQQLRRTANGSARAIAHYMEALDRDPRFARAWAELAKSANFAHTWAFTIPGIDRDSLLSLAVNASDRAVELDPADPVSWLAKGRVSRLVDPTDNGPAMFALQKSLALDSMNADAWFEFGTVRQELLDDDGTEKAWLRAAALNPTDAQTLSFLGFHYMWRGEYARGVPWTDSAIKMDPTTVVARESAAELALELGRPVIAQRHWDVQIRVLTGRQQGAPLAMIARAYLAQGDTATARSYVRRAEGVADIKNPNRHEAVWIGSAYAAIGDTAAAIRILKAYQPRGDLHFQLHMKRDPGLRWLRGKLGEGLLFPDPRK